SVSRISDWVFDYLIRWWWVIGMVFWISVGWALWCGVTALLEQREHWRWLHGLRLAAGCLAALLLVNVPLHNASEFGQGVPPEPEFQAATRALSEPTIAATPVGGPVYVRTEGAGAGSVADGIRLQLERADRPVLVSSDVAYKFGSQRDVAN